MDVDEDRRGIIPRGRKFVVHMRLPGGKKTWIPVANMETAKRIVKIIKIYVTGFKALGDDHPDGPGLLDEFRSAEFKQVVLQALESETDFLQQEGGVNQSTTAEVPEGMIREVLIFFSFGAQRRPEVHIRLSVDMLEEMAGLGFFCNFFL